MICREVKEKLSEYKRKLLPSREEEEIKKHLDGCGDCHLYLHELEEIMAMLGENEEQ